MYGKLLAGVHTWIAKQVGTCSNATFVFANAEIGNNITGATCMAFLINSKIGTFTRRCSEAGKLDVGDDGPKGASQLQNVSTLYSATSEVCTTMAMGVH